MTNNSKVTLKEGMHFIGELEGFEFNLDADPNFGGKNNGPKPKGLILTALAGCTSMDVISVLRKMKVEPEEFFVNVEGELSEEHPKVYKDILITYHFKGNIKKEQAEKAIDLSLTKYCGVAAMLKKSSNVNYNIVIE
ncbi:MAG: hypothetical protein A2086_11905 [Spirochaetes bacterium GWD1_27_9]|nr:MAG: hypothetical protein A2Z98_11830 [Spirochaetes bacterium GWB1_27_13]OHD28112.1 MAG: hypothetical protein A2Y34_05620 [Spirochaetes bacterium GWC1_27_15]OHD35500.1 MAG: hypothetical protein A2086_11905 [Spirochaetes bacterium GWD1_27_9]